MNTFHGYVKSFPNSGLHTFVAELIKFRKQLTVRSEFRSQSGWDNSLNNYLTRQLEQLADTLENITYNPDDTSREDLLAQSADTTRSLADDYNVKAMSSDNVLMPVATDRPVVWVLDGSDPDLPQMTPENCPNDFARVFVAGLDNVFVQATRLDSRWQPTCITKYESTMLRSLLNQLYTITQRKGGEANRSDTVQGVLPSMEAETFQGGEVKVVAK